MGILVLLSHCVKLDAPILIRANRARNDGYWGWLIKRGLTQAQVSTALRPFYFLVHPDLLAKFPKERQVNEKSLQSLKMYLNVMLDERKVVQNPVYTTFYIKPRTQREKQNKSKLKSVRLHLKQERKVRSAVINILKGCDLPTSYIDSIPERFFDNRIIFRVTLFKQLGTGLEYLIYLEQMRIHQMLHEF